MVAIIRDIVEAEEPIYTSIGDFVREALREKIERYELSNKNRKHSHTKS
jgi:Arc/MetJ-type ribon-helix-helix transcriptional regulator